MNEIKQRLRSSRNWVQLIDTLEAEVNAVDDRQERSRRLYALGQACESLFLRKDKAMVNYQKAFKLFPQDVRPLVRARQIYHEMGNLKNPLAYSFQPYWRDWLVLQGSWTDRFLQQVCPEAQLHHPARLEWL